MNGEVQYIIVGVNGKQYGPMNLETLKSLVRDERVGAETQIWDSTTGEWHEAQQIEELEEFFPEEGVDTESTGEGASEEEVSEPYTSALGLASMWCGIVSVPTFCCMGWVLALMAIILGFVARHEVKRYGYEGGQYATIGIICGIVALVMTGILAIMFGPSFYDVLAEVIRKTKP